MTSNEQSDLPVAGASRLGLVAGALTAILASACCLGPLVLLTLGISGAWIGSLRALEPFRPVFLGVTMVALYFAHRRIFRPAAECAPGEICAVPAVNRSYKALFVIVAALLVIALVFPYIAPLFY